MIKFREKEDYLFSPLSNNCLIASFRFGIRLSNWKSSIRFNNSLGIVTNTCLFLVLSTAI